MNAVTLQFLDVVPPARLDWRPDAGSFTVGEHLQHIVQTNEYYRSGLFGGEWDASRLRLTDEAHDGDALRARFQRQHAAMSDVLATVSDADLARPVAVPHAPGEFPLRWWLWFVLEHEIHHKAQLSVYLRQMGLVAPFYAMPMQRGERPDIAARRQLQGE